ncbi:hypothetical protein Tco_0796248 [Tanacetum coccineum]
MIASDSQPPSVEVPSQKASQEDVERSNSGQRLSDDSDDSNDDDDPPIFWPAFAAWEVVPTGLGDVNALYFMDKSSKYFTHLREILHLVDRKDLFKLYGLVVQYYDEHPLAGSGMILWGDLQVLFESHKGGTGAGVWADQQQWVIRSWRLFPFSGVHVLETISGKILYMFADTPYPLLAQLMKKMLKHKLEVEIDGIGNDMTYAEQLIQFIKNQAIRLESIEVWFQFPGYPKLDGFHLPYSWNEKWLVQEGTALGKDIIKSVDGCDGLPKTIRDLNSPMFHVPKNADFLVADSKFMKVAFGVGFKMIVVPSSGIVTTSRYVVPTGRVKVPAGRYVVPTGKDNVIVGTGRSKVIHAGRTTLVLRVLRKQVVRVSWVFKKPTALDEVGD